MGYTMKQMMTKLETFFLTMTLVDDCEFERGLQVRYRRLRGINSKMRG